MARRVLLSLVVALVAAVGVGGSATADPADYSAPVAVASGAQGAYVDIDSGPDGIVHLVYVGFTESGSDVFYFSKPQGGSWSGPVLVSTNPHQGIQGVELLIYGTTPSVLWGSANPNGIWYATLGGGGWSAPDLVSAGDLGDFDAAVAPDGTMHVLWKHGSWAYHKSRSLAGVWSDGVRLSSLQGKASEMGVAVASDGSAHAVWRENPQVLYARMPNGGSWSASEGIPGVTAGPLYDIAADGSGTVHLAQARCSGITYTSRASAGGWSAATVIPGSANAGRADWVDGASGGRLRLVWRKYASTCSSASGLVSAEMDPTLGWQTPIDLYDETGHPSSAYDVAATDWDAAGPANLALTLPATYPSPLYISSRLSGPDTDGDGLSDDSEINGNPSPKTALGTFITDPFDADTDDDGCTDGQELGVNEMFGGRRDPTSFWDFYSVWTYDSGPGWYRDASVGLFQDIFATAMRFGAVRPGGPPSEAEALTEALTPPVYITDYHASYDRSEAPEGLNPWNVGPPDGEIDLFTDIFGVAFQFGHEC